MVDILQEMQQHGVAASAQPCSWHDLRLALCGGVGTPWKRVGAVKLSGCCGAIIRQSPAAPNGQGWWQHWQLLDGQPGLPPPEPTSRPLMPAIDQVRAYAESLSEGPVRDEFLERIQQVQRQHLLEQAAKVRGPPKLSTPLEEALLDLIIDIDDHRTGARRHHVLVVLPAINNGF
jgi:hypothetical protein